MQLSVLWSFLLTLVTLSTKYDVTEAQGSITSCPPLDLHFILETSATTGSRGFNQAIFFIRSIIQNFIIGEGHTRVSLTLFNNTVRDIFDLNEYSTRKGVYDALSPTIFRPERSPGNARVGNAMQWMAKRKFTPERGRRDGVSAVCVFFVEGKSADKVDEAAKELDQKCRIIAIGVNRADFFQLTRMASEPSIGHVKTLLRFNDLTRQKKWLLEVLCVPPLVSPRLKRTSTNPDSLVITWDDQEFAAYYILELRLSGVPRVLDRKNVTKGLELVEFTRLNQATTYSIIAWAVSTTGKEGPKATLFSTTALKAPDLMLKPNSVTRTSATVMWTENTLNGVNYYVTVRRMSDQIVVDSEATFGTSHKIEKLEPGAGYAVEVKALNLGVSSPLSNTVIFFTDSLTPAITVQSQTSNSIRVSWKEQEGVAGYVVRTYSGTGKNRVQIKENTVTTTLLTVKPLQAGESYEFTVASVNEEGRESNPSSPVTGKTAPSNPTISEIKNITTNSLQLHWKPQKSAVKYTMIYQRRGVGPSAPIQIELIGTSYKFRHLESGSTYTVKLQAFGKGDVTDPETVDAQLIYTAPMQVGRVTIQESTTNTTTLEWPPVSGAVVYIVEFEPPEKDRKAGYETQIQNSESTSHLMTGLSPGVKYSVKVVAQTEGDIRGKPSVTVYAITDPDTPTDARLKSSSNSSLEIEWSAMKGAEAYIVSYKREGRTQWTQVTVEQTEYAMNFLRDGTFYEFMLRSIGTGNKVNNNPSPILKVQTVPFQPELIFIDETTTNSITARWNEVRGAAYYLVLMVPMDPVSFISDREVQTSQTSLTLDSLSAGEAYGISIISVGFNEKRSPSSRVVSETTLPAKPGAPEALEIRSTSVTLEWEGIKGAEKYMVNVEYGTESEVYESENPSYTVNDLTPGTWVTFSIQSVGVRDRVNEQKSETLTVQTAPSVPQNFRILSWDTNFVGLMWSPVKGARNYMVGYSSTNGLNKGNVQVAKTTLVIDGLLSGTEYEFMVFAIGDGEGRSDDSVVLTETTIPETPNTLTFITIGTESITLQWKDVTGAEKYIVTMAENDNITKIDSVFEEIKIPNLISGKFYEFSVQSVGTRERINPIPSASIKTQTMPKQPSNITLISSTTTSLSIKWEQQEGIKQYNVVIEDSENVLISSEMVTDPFIEINDLEEGELYSIVITAISVSNKTSERSVPLDITTVPARPKKPVVTFANETIVELSWNAVTGAVAYNVLVRGVKYSTEHILTSDKSVVAVEKLSPGILYEFSIQSVGSKNRVNPEESEKVQQKTVVASPSNITVTDETITLLAFTWDIVEGAVEYIVEETIISKSNVTIKKTHTITDNFYLADNLLSETMYIFVITAVADDGVKSKPSEALEATTMTETPSPPHFHGTSNTSIILEWRSIIGAAHYIVYYKMEGTNKTLTLKTKESHATLLHLVPGSWYEIWLKTVGRIGIMSNPSEIVRRQTIPSSDISVKIDNIGTNFIYISWEDVKGAVKYFVDIDWWDGIGTSEKVVETTQHSVNLTNLFPGTEYDIHLRVLSESNVTTEKGAGIHEFTLSSTPTMPSLLNVTHANIIISWEPVNGALSYVVKILDELNDATLFITDETSFVFVGLEPGVMHGITLMSFNERNATNGIESVSLQVQTVPLEPSEIELREVNPKSMLLHWQAPKGAEFYVLTLSWMQTIGTNEINTLFQPKDYWTDNIVVWRGEDVTSSNDVSTYTVISEKISFIGDRNEYVIHTRSNAVLIDGMESGTKYQITVASVGLQRKQSRDSVQMEEYTLPATTAISETHNVTISTIEISWDSVVGGASYIVGVMQTIGDPYNITIKDATSALVHNLKAGEYFHLKVYSVGVNGRVNPKASDQIIIQTVPLPVSGIKVLNVRTSFITFSWEPVLGSSIFMIETRLEGEDKLLKSDSIAGNQFTVTDLTPGTDYVINIQGLSDSGRTAPTVFKIQTLPLPPENLAIYETTETKISLRWFAASGAIAYRISLTSNHGANITHNTTETDFVVSELLPGTFYKIELWSIGKENRINEEPASEILEQTVPLSPSDARLDNVTYSSIDLVWTAIEGAQSYEVTVVEDNNAVNGIVETTTSNKISLLGLKPGTMYLISVASVAKYISKKTVLNIATVPQHVTLFYVDDITTTSIGLSWKNMIGAQSYRISVKIDPNDTVYKNVASNTNSYLFDKLSPGIVYSFEVTTVGLQDRISIPSDSFKVQTTPKQPTAAVISEITNTTALVTWKPVIGALEYRIVVTDVLYQTSKIFTSVDTTYMIDSLQAGTEYTVVIETVGVRGEFSTGSKPSVFYTVPPSPSNWKVTDVTPTTVKIQWSVAVGASSYEVSLRLFDDATKTTRKSMIIDVTNVRFEELTPGTKYDIIVITIGMDGKRSVLLPSDEMIVQTVPGVITGFAISYANETTIGLKWNSVKGASKYILTSVEDSTLAVQKYESVETSIFVNDLQPGFWYTFSVQTVGPSGRINPQTSNRLQEQTVSSKTGGIVFTDVSTTSLVVHWTESVGAQYYDVFVRAFNSTEIIDKISSSKTSATVSSLIPGTLYSFSIIAVTGSGKQSEESNFKSTTTLIDAPNVLELKSTYTDSFTLTWENVLGAVSYTITVKERDTDFETTLNSIKPEMTVMDMVPGTWYIVQVKSIGSSKVESDESDQLIVQTVPSKPVGLKVLISTVNSFGLAWEPVKGAYTYEVESISYKDGEEVFQTWQSDENSLMMIGLTSGTEFKIKVTAVGDRHFSEDSDYILENTLPDTATGLKVIDASTDTISLQWNEVTGAVSYEIDVERVDILELLEFTSSTNKLLISSLSAGATYNITVLSLDAKSRSNGESSEAIVIQTAPSPPSNLISNMVTVSTIEVSWDRVQGAQGYEVTASWKNGRGESEKNTVSAMGTNAVLELPLPGTSYTIHTVALGTNYRSSESEKIVENTLPLLPIEIATGEITTTTIELSWDQVEGSASFEIIVQQPDKKKPMVFKSETNFVLIEGLAPGEEYEISLLSKDSKGRTSGDVSFPILVQTVMSLITGLQVTDVYSKTISVAWNETFGAKSYIVTARWSLQPGDTVSNREFETIETNAILDLPHSGIDYDITVSAISGSLRSEESSIVTENTLPDSPNPPEIIAVTETSISLQWESIQGASAYQINVTQLDGNGSSSINVTASKAKVDKLEAGRLYTIALFSIDRKKRIHEQGSIPIEVQTVPPKITNFTVTRVTNSVIEFSWEAVYGVLEYYIAMHSATENTSLSFTPNEDDLLLGGNIADTTLNVEELDAGSYYFFTITAIGKHQTERKSDALKFIESTLPLTPSTPVVSEVTSTSVYLEWDSVPGASDYDVEYIDRTTGINDIIRTQRASIAINNLLPATYYQVNVLSFDKKNRTNNVKTRMIELQTAPEVTTEVRILDVTTTTISIEWDAVTNAVSYNVDVYWKEEGSQPQIIKSILPNEQSITLTTQEPQQVIKNLIPGTQYWITVTSVSESGRKSAPSERVAERTMPITAGSLIVDRITTSSAVFNWKTVKGASGYILVVQDILDPSGYFEKNVTTNSVLLDKLKFGTIYDAAVYTIGSKDRINEVPSNVVSFKTVTLPATKLTVNNKTTTSIGLSWSASNGSTDFEVIAKYESDGKSLEIKVDTIEKSVLLEDLLPGTMYEITVITYGDFEKTQAGKPSDVLMQQTVPNAPSGTVASAITSNSMTLSWRPSTGATKYLILLSNEETNQTLTIDAGLNLQAEISNLTSGTLYNLTVKAIVAGDDSLSVSGVTIDQRTAPLAPQKINTTFFDEYNVHLQWEESHGAFSYQVTVYTKNLNGERVVLKDVKDIRSNVFKTANLKPGVVHEFEIVGLTVEGIKSAKSDVHLQMTNPAIPTGIRTSNITNTSFIVTWQQNTGATSYKLDLSISGQNDVEEYNIENGTTLLLDGLQTGTTYSFTIVALANNGTLNSKPSEIVRQGTKPNLPQNITVVDVQATKISLYWNKVFGATSYTIHLIELKGEKPFGKMNVIKVAGVNTKVLDKLKPGVGYQFDIHSTTEFGISSPHSDKFREFTRPKKPSGIKTNVIKPTSFTVTWFKSIGATLYVVKVVNDDTLEEIEVSPGNPKVPLAASITGLEPGTLYRIYVRAYSLNNNSESVESDVKNQRTVPLTPVIRNVTNIASTSVDLIWDPVKGASSYSVNIFLTGIPPGKKNPAREITDITELPATIGQLKPGVSYSFFVQGITQEGIRTPKSPTVEQMTVPRTPIGITYSLVKSTSMTVSWEKVVGATSYTLILTNQDSLVEKKMELENVLTVSLSDLEPGTNYSVSLQSERKANGLFSGHGKPVYQTTAPLKPQNLTVVDQGSNYLLLEWELSKGADTYSVHVVELKGDKPTGKPRIIKAPKETARRVDKLKPGVQYQLDIHAVTEFGVSSPHSTSFREYTRPKTPTGLTTKQVKATSFTVSWLQSPGAILYVVKVVNDDTLEETEVKPGNPKSPLSAAITGLEPGTMHTITVRAFSINNSSESLESIPKKQRTAPIPPSVFNVTRIEANEIGFKWNFVKGASSYAVQVLLAGVPKGKNNQPRNIPNIQDTQVIVNQLKPGLLYTFQVTAITKEGFTSVKSAQLDQITVPHAPAGIIFTLVKPTSMKLSWKKVPGATSYALEVTNQDTLVKETKELGNVLSFALTELEAGTNYSVSMQSKREDESLLSAQSKLFFQSTTPLPPQNITANDIGANYINLQWVSSKGASSYSITVQEIKNLKPFMKPKILKSDTNSRKVDKLKPGTMYEFSVQSISPQQILSALSVTYKQYTEPKKPTGISTKLVKANSFQVTWLKTFGAKLYVVKVINDDTLEEQIVTPQNPKLPLAAFVSDVQPGSIHTITVKAFTPGNSSESEESLPIKQRTAPNPPTTIKVTKIASEEIGIEWNFVEGASSYTVHALEVLEVAPKRGMKPVPKIVEGIKDNKVVVDQLKGGTVYSLSVQAVAAEGPKSVKSATIEQITAPQVPFGITFTLVKSTSMKVSWKKLRGATSYSLTLINRETLVEETKSLGNVLELQLTDLDPGTNYSVSLQSERKNDSLFSAPSRLFYQSTAPLPPQNVTIVAVTLNSMSLTWTPSKGAAGYVVTPYHVTKVWKKEKRVPGNPVTVTKPFAKVLRLKPASVYEFKVAALTPQGQAGQQSFPVQNQTNYFAPEMPKYKVSPIKVTGITKTSMKASWPELKNAASYTLVVRTNFADDMYFSDLKVRQKLLQNLTLNTQYRLTFYATGRSGDESAESDPPATVWTRPNPPKPPTNLRITDVTHTSLILRWDTEDLAITYIASREDIESGEIITSKQLIEPEYRFENLITDKYFKFTVYSVGKFENSTTAEPLRAKAEYTLPQIEKSFKISAKEIGWNYFVAQFPPIFNAQSYNVTVKSKSGKVILAVGGLNETFIRVEDLTQATDYFVSVSALAFGPDEIYTEQSKEFIITTGYDTPVAPVNITATNVTDSSAILKWENVPRAKSYSVRITDLTTADLKNHKGILSPFVIKGLEFYTEYEVSIKSDGMFDSSSYSKPFTFRTTYPMAGIVNGIEVEFVTHNSVRLGWTPVEYTSGYRVLVYFNDILIQQYKVGSNRYTIEGLKPKSTYKVGILALGAGRDAEDTTLHRYIITKEAPLNYTEHLGSGTYSVHSSSQETPAITNKLQPILRSMVSTLMEIGDSPNNNNLQAPSIQLQTELKQSLNKLEVIIRNIDLSRGTRKSLIIVETNATDPLRDLMALGNTIQAKLVEDGSDVVATEIASIITVMFINDGTDEAEAIYLRNILHPTLRQILDEVKNELVLKIIRVTPTTVEFVVTGIPKNANYDVLIRDQRFRKVVGHIPELEEGKRTVFTNLEAFTQYDVYVRNKNTGFMVTLQAINTKHSTPPVGPPIPGGLSTAYVTSSVVGLRWNPVRIPGQATTYILRIYEGFSITPARTMRVTSRTIMYVSGLARTKVYHFTVASYNSRTKTESEESGRLYVKMK